MEKGNRRILTEGAKVFGIALDEKGTEAFALFMRELFKWNQKINLTAIRTEREAVLKHFLDSLSVHPHLPNPCCLLDLGSGAGFPGIPLKIADRSLGVILIDSIRKKVDFQRHIIRSLDLKGIEAIQDRVGAQTTSPGVGRQVDVVVSRAFSDTRRFLSLSHPLLRTGGIALAMKGALRNGEIQILKEAGGNHYRFQRTVQLKLPFSSFRRSLLFFEKG